MQIQTKAFIFSVSKASSAVDEIVVIADSREQAETELRVMGILYCGGLPLHFVREVPRGVHKSVPDRQGAV